MSRVREKLRAFWSGPGGGRAVLVVAYPLILSQMSFTLQTFVDRLFLTWYSAEAVAGAVTGLFATWGIIGLFVGTGEYLTTFVAQYSGAGRRERIGPAIWQGIYFSLLAGLCIAALAPLAEPVFALAGHAPHVRRFEVVSAQIFMLGSFPIVLMATLSTFFAGRGQTGVVLLVNVASTLVNVVLDYLWIFGHAGLRAIGRRRGGVGDDHGADLRRSPVPRAADAPRATARATTPSPGGASRGTSSRVCSATGCRRASSTPSRSAPSPSS